MSTQVSGADLMLSVIFNDFLVWQSYHKAEKDCNWKELFVSQNGGCWYSCMLFFVIGPVFASDL